MVNPILVRFQEIHKIAQPGCLRPSPVPASRLMHVRILCPDTQWEEWAETPCGG
jgi:hypothetical protein